MKVLDEDQIVRKPGYPGNLFSPRYALDSIDVRLGDLHEVESAIDAQGQQPAGDAGDDEVIGMFERSGRQVEAPAPLFAGYPRLSESAMPQPAQIEAGDLFK